MKEKKHIDSLFKERFKNFEVDPSPHVWDAIQAKLNKEDDDRKVIPLWWKFAGVAAILALLLTVGTTLFNPIDDGNSVTKEETTPLDLNESENEVIDNDYINMTEIASEETEIPSTEKASEAASEINESITPSTTVDESASIKKVEEAIASKDSPKKNTVSDGIISKNTDIGVAIEDGVAVSDSDSKNSEGEKINSGNPLINKEKSIESTSIGVVSETKDNNEKKEGDLVSPQNNEVEVNKDGAASKKRSLLDVINEKEEEKAVAKTSEAPQNRWDVTPNFAPVYYNSLGDGSSIDPSFSDNSKSGDVNFSYGVQVSYNLSKRLSVRTGVNNVDLSYGTTGLELGTAPVASALKTINYGGKQVVVTALDEGTFAAQSPGDNPFDNITPKSTSGEVSLIQDIQYFEVPLELKYAVLNTKIGVHIIGGLSTLFLGDNEVYVQANDYKEILGEANNLSSVSFATNVGLGFDYKISKRLKFNIEPMFKYQLNTYTDSSVDFKPYYIGVYSGLSFKF